jgi:hypothetical protein
MQIAARDAHVAVPSGITDLGQRPSASQRMAEKGVAAVVNGQRLEPGISEDFTRRPKPLP